MTLSLRFGARPATRSDTPAGPLIPASPPANSMASESPREAHFATSTSVKKANGSTTGKVEATTIRKMPTAASLAQPLTGRAHYVSGVVFARSSAAAMRRSIASAALMS